MQVIELHNVDIIRAQRSKAGIEVFVKASPGLCLALSGNDGFAAPALKSSTDFFLGARCVDARVVEKGYAAIQRFLGEGYRLVLR